MHMATLTDFSRQQHPVNAFAPKDLRGRKHSRVIDTSVHPFMLTDAAISCRENYVRRTELQAGYLAGMIGSTK
jgi:hypothetical protein